MAARLPKSARDLLQTIDLQLASIDYNLGQDGDFNFAIHEQRAELEEWRRQVLDEPKQAKLRKQAECGTCLEVNPKGDMLKMQCCDTRYCKACFQEWIQGLVNAQEIPKCCDQEINVAKHPYRFYLDKSTKKKHKALKRELEAQRKLWCSNQRCGKLINPDIEPVEGFVTCSACRKKTCATCAKAVDAHKGRQMACAGYIKDEELNEAIERNSWKRCPRCHVPVEKTEGCNNVRCKCGVLFCFQCGISKPSELSQCRCTDPTIQADETVEDPDGDDWKPQAIVDDESMFVGEAVLHDEVALVAEDEVPIADFVDHSDGDYAPRAARMYRAQPQRIVRAETPTRSAIPRFEAPRVVHAPAGLAARLAARRAIRIARRSGISIRR